MKLVRTGGLCLVVGLVIGAVVATAAMAEAPEYGRCVPQLGGKFKDPGCTEEVATLDLPGKSPSKGKFEWRPGVANSNFTTTATGKKVVLESVGKHQITCKGETGSGHYSGPKTVHMSIALTGCETEGIPAESEIEGTKEGEIVLGRYGLEGRLGIIKAGATPAKDVIGLQMEPPVEEKEYDECIIWDDGNGHFGEDCVPVIDVSADPPAVKMALASTIKFVQAKGHQKPEHLEGGPLAVIFSSFDGGELEQTGLSLTMTQASEESVEINPVV